MFSKSYVTTTKELALPWSYEINAHRLFGIEGETNRLRKVKTVSHFYRFEREEIFVVETLDVGLEVLQKEDLSKLTLPE